MTRRRAEGQHNWYRLFELLGMRFGGSRRLGSGYRFPLYWPARDRRGHRPARRAPSMRRLGYFSGDRGGHQVEKDTPNDPPDCGIYYDRDGDGR